MSKKFFVREAFYEFKRHYMLFFFVWVVFSKTPYDLKTLNYCLFLLLQYHFFLKMKNLSLDVNQTDIRKNKQTDIITDIDLIWT